MFFMFKDKPWFSNNTVSPGDKGKKEFPNSKQFVCYYNAN